MKCIVAISSILILFVWGLVQAATSPLLLAQSNPAATTLTDIFTVSSDPLSSAIITTVWVTNRDSAPHYFRMSIAPRGYADSAEQYIYYNVDVPARGALIQSVSLPLTQGDVVRVWADAQQLSFSLYGSMTMPTPTPTPSQTPTPSSTPTETPTPTPTP